MKKITIDEYKEDPERIIERVEEGEKVIVTNGIEDGILEVSDDEYYRIMTDHGDGP